MEAALREAASGVTPARALAALAMLAPDACLQFLCDHAAQIGAVIPGTEISSAIAAALRAFDGERAARQAHAVEVFLRYRDMLAVDAATEMLRAFGTGFDAKDGILEHFVERFPTDSAVLRAAVAAARSGADDERLDALLTKLALADKTPATLAFVHRLRPATPAGSQTGVRAALLSSYTIDNLVPYVDLACRTLRVVPDIYVAPFNSWTRDIVDEASGLRRFAPDIAFLAVAIDDLMPQLVRALSPEELETGGELALERVLSAARHYASWARGAPLVVHSFHSAFAAPLGIADGRDHPSRSAWLAALNARLGAELRKVPSCYVLDMTDAVVASGAALADNPKLRHLAAMRLPPQALAGVADAYARYIAPLKGLTRKCVVLDLDNTLWGGVVGEDGKDGIRLGSTAPGSEFVEFQEFLRSLTERGILLAINSKNNADEALDAIRTHEAMVLRESHFSAIRINWKSKPDNMQSIAAELNVGIDSLVFVDDNPDEREQMRQLLPEVLTVELPRDAALYRSVLERLPQLQTLAITHDDRGRLAQYATQRLRSDARATTTSVEDYLGSLAIEVDIAAASDADLARVVQLFAKTNQFNTTTQRYDSAAVQRFAGDEQMRLWVLRSKDRFGNHGLVALALVRTTPQLWTIESFLMSCRVIGYGIETALLAFVAERARAMAARAIGGAFVATAKNAPASDLYERHGFATSDGPGPVRFWQLDLAQQLDFPAWIARSRDDA